MKNAGLSRLCAYFCLACGMSLVGSYVALTRPLSQVLPIFLLAWLRFSIGVVAMLGWLRKPAHEEPIGTQTRWLLFAESLFGNFLFTCFMITGVRLTSVAAASVIMATIPAVVALLGWLLLGEHLTLRFGMSIVCAVLGVLLLALAALPAMQITQPTPNSSTLRVWLGYGALFCAVLCEALYSIIGKKLTTALSAKRITALVNLWSFVLATPLGFYFARGFDFSSVPVVMWWLLLFYALAASVVSVWLWMTGLRVIPAAQAGVFTVFLPIAAALTGVWALNETLSFLQWLALAVALLSVVLATMPVSVTLRRAS